MKNNIQRIYIDRLGLYFEDADQLVDYITHHYKIFTKEELRDIILELADDQDEVNNAVYDAGHHQEWMDRHPYGYYNNESDYGTGDEED